MKTLVCSGSLWVLLCTVSSGAPLCTPGNLQTYVALGSDGCEVGTVEFSDFTIVPGQALGTAINPADVQVSLGATALNPQLLFSLNENATRGELLESFFRFSASGFVMGASIALTSTNVTGSGAVTGILDVCPGGSFSGESPFGCPTSPASLIVFALDQSSLLSASAGLAQASSFDVFVNLMMDGGGNGSATLNSAAVGFTVVPEPSSGLLAAIGSSAILLYRIARRRTSDSRSKD